MGDARRRVRLINWTIIKVFLLELALSALDAEPFPNAREMSGSYDVSDVKLHQKRHWTNFCNYNEMACPKQSHFACDFSCL